ncbi:unnamed protein product [Dovyalis caffra]|uniref:Uncharacterized protein n=1 Tax=Dovyalis caffra TaxID=77055 RepID=A0AAV1R6H7_9ROSI|nr:unnamed protein product [Dovyalis caffra]
MAETFKAAFHWEGFPMAPTAVTRQEHNINLIQAKPWIIPESGPSEQKQSPSPFNAMDTNPADEMMGSHSIDHGHIPQALGLLISFHVRIQKIQLKIPYAKNLDKRRLNRFAPNKNRSEISPSSPEDE